MKAFNAYLIFNGNCREAMNFYAKSLDAELDLIIYSDSPCEAAKAGGDKIMHARLQKGSAILMASDGRPDQPANVGNNFLVSLDCENAPEIEKFFSALGEKGTVIMPLQGTFWAARFGMLTDQFGVNWMFNLEQPKTNDHAAAEPELVGQSS